MKMLTNILVKRLCKAQTSDFVFLKEQQNRNTESMRPAAVTYTYRTNTFEFGVPFRVRLFQNP